MQHGVCPELGGVTINELKLGGVSSSFSSSQFMNLHDSCKANSKKAT